MIYAAGGGYGHCMRALSLARCAVKRNPKRSITLIGNQTGIRKIEQINRSSGIVLRGLDNDLRKPDFQQQSQTELSKWKYSTLIVDTFPRGIVGELTPFLQKESSIKKVFVHRDIVPEYIA